MTNLDDALAAGPRGARRRCSARPDGVRQRRQQRLRRHVDRCLDDAPPATTIDYRPVQDYLFDHTRRLVDDTATLQRDAEAYYALAEAADFDYAQLLRTRRAEVQRLVTQLQRDLRTANPSYEEMEGVVAGVPELADYDVIIDAGGDASDPENAVPFDIRTPAGKTYRQPGNFFALVETSVFGTDPKFTVRGVRADLER